MSKTTLVVQGMSCQHCVKSIESALKTIGTEGKADLSQATVTVEFDEMQVNIEKIKQTIEDQGYVVKA